MEHLLATSLWLPRPREEIFTFFGDAGNLALITPPELHFKILTPLPLNTQRGTLIDYKLRLFGMPIRWRTAITEWTPATAFVDAQVRGPYAQWIHTHRFRDHGGGTLIEDHVRYRLPFAPLGELVHPIVRLELSRIFRFRETAVWRYFCGSLPA